MTKLRIFGDHVELSDQQDDFASSIGIGAVVGTEFTWPVGSGPMDSNGKRPNDLSAEREQRWSKWLEIYKTKMLPKGQYLGSLYDIGFDQPESHAILKDDKMYYSFFAKSFDGKVQLRGLQKRKYRVRDYVNNQDLSTVAGPIATLRGSFLRHLLIETSPD